MDPKRNKESNQGYIPVITRKESSKVWIKEILYIEKELRLIKIYTAGRVYSFYGKLDDIMKYLDDNFYRCHRSCVVNLDKILRMEKGIFYLEGGKTLRVGQNNYQYTRSYYRRFLEKNDKAKEFE
ncbi:LytR/AlgR family response regulator transcription factor [Sinanaerobacter chloroacetimidivorans]|uniref:LytTR family transcriptional regulator DNA-binding domain-containing protein n=1 Tax=Sinanaerobacter chloroacetimidivorans TaxID=2818044 RepID=A0A8J7VXB3_9FIRM|nr:LytTR family DNA-binding domain-containing protein [Sinanaerobacter chloroacetimidivorans]MBR0596777.1 LytTR family transcriptional regulator DNA-binding domain-containing protein [Sinanaerobacter chloroacetimidivorans]